MSEPREYEDAEYEPVPDDVPYRESSSIDPPQGWWRRLLSDPAVKVTIVLIIGAVFGVFDWRSDEWQRDVFDQLEQLEARLDETTPTGLASPQGLLDIQNLNLELGNKDAQIRGLEESLALARAEAAESRRALSTSRAAIDAAVNTCMATATSENDNVEAASSASALSDRLDRALGVFPSSDRP